MSYRFCSCCFLYLFLGITSEKIYLRDLDKNAINVSSFWNVKTCPGYTGWFSSTDPLKPKEVKFNVCFSLDCMLETFQFSIAGVNTVFADYTLIGRYCGAKEPAQCTEYIDVGANIGDTRILNPSNFTTTKPWVAIPSPYDRKIKDSQEFFTAFGTIFFENDGKKYISYVFNSRFVCGALFSFVVYYYKCPTVIESLARFEEHSAPNKNKGVKLYDGRCFINAVKVNGTEPILKCMWNGSYETTGQCQCAPGYEKHQNTCQKCGTHAFKTQVGNDRCEQCTENSIANSERTGCNCLNGFYEDNGKCFGPQHLATDIQLLEFSESTVTIKITKGQVNVSSYLVVVSPKNRISLSKPFTLTGYDASNEDDAYVTGVFDENEEIFFVGDGRIFNHSLYNKNHSTDSWKIFENVPLKPATKYSILVVAYGNQDIFYTTSVLIIHTRQAQHSGSTTGTSVTTIIVGIISGLVAISLIILFQIFFRRRIRSSKRNSKPREIANVHIYETVDEFVKSNHQSSAVNRERQNVLYQSDTSSLSEENLGKDYIMDDETSKKGYQELKAAYKSDGLYQGVKITR